MSSDDGDYTQEIFDAYGRILVENYCIIASSVLLFADTFMTLTREVQRIWQRRFTGATAVFLITRYVAVAERIVLLVSLFFPAVADEVSSCVPVLRLDDALTDISYLMFGVFLILRARGIWGRGWAPLVILTLLTPIRPILSIYNQVHYTPLAFGPPLYGCGAIIDNALYTHYVGTVGITSRAAGLVIDATVLVLTWARTIGMKRESRRLGLHTPLVTLLLRDAGGYTRIILIIQICGIVSVSVGNSFVLWDVWPYFDQVFTVIFSCRFMLDLRGVYLIDQLRSHPGDTDPYDDTYLPLSGLRFSGSIVGNMGAPLDTFGVGTKTHVRSPSGASSVGASSEWTHWSERDSEETDMETLETSQDPLSVGLYHPVDVELQDTPSAPA
ncbi:hypothetical protein BC628DRAFT_1328565 [Trametes gibbosa]|nr:hypothetical protein BC628DRAFT_1328565 [Trametes gibbosa]